MDHKTLGWIQVVGGVLALVFPGGGVGMMGMMGFDSGMMGGWAVAILALLFIITGIHHLTEKHK